MKNNKFDKYKTNLKYDDDYIYSYNTKVGEIKKDSIIVNQYWSMTTTKHLNYASKQLHKEIIYNGN